MLKIDNKPASTHTHRLEFDVLMKDLTARKIEVNFNGWDEWSDTGCSPLEAAGFLYRGIIKQLDRDKFTLGWKATLFNLSDPQKKVTEFAPYAKVSLI